MAEKQMKEPQSQPEVSPAPQPDLHISCNPGAGNAAAAGRSSPPGNVRSLQGGFREVACHLCEGHWGSVLWPSPRSRVSHQHRVLHSLGPARGGEEER